MSAQVETFQFKTDVKRVLDIIIRSLYQHKDVFLRELISNSSDALSKAKIKSLTNEPMYQKGIELKIELIPNAKEGTLTIKDTGIGMTKEELAENLGTIAKSGTLEFLEKIESVENKAELIGQFGVGFYSAFLVADKVVVRSRSFLPEAEAYEWVSDGVEDFTINKIDKEDRGTEVVLYLKEDDQIFLRPYKLRELVKKYSDFVSFPIYLIEEEDEEEEEKEQKEEKEEKEEKKPEILNSMEAIWRKNPSEVKEEQYLEFYRQISNKWDEPFLKIHIRTESPIEFFALIYIPATKISSIYLPEAEWGLKLYSKKILVQEHNKELLPEYLRFVVGVVDSEDLPLNVSREVVQSGKVIRTIKKYLEKKIIEELESLAEKDEEKYLVFYREYGALLKEGIAQQSKYKDLLIKLLRFYSTDDSVDGRTGAVSLDDYLVRMKPKQEEIYYLLGNDIEVMKNSPHLEYYKKEGYEVLLLPEPIDSFLMMHLREYEEKKFKNIDRDDSPDEPEAKEKDEKQEETKGPHAELINKFKEILKERVKDVKISDKLVTSPARLVTPKDGLDSGLQRALHLMQGAQGGGKFGDELFKDRVLQINPNNEIIKKIEGNLDSAVAEAMIKQIYYDAVMAEGEVPDLKELVSNIETIMASMEGVK